MNPVSLSNFRKFWMPFGLIYVFSVFAISFALANDADDVQKELRQKAVRLFKDEKYVEATPLFSQLLSLNNKDTLLNYYYGSCLSMQPDVSQNGAGYLEAALNSRKIPDDAWFYYARSLFYSGQYANAQAAFTRYLSTDDHDKLKVASANNYVHNCESALELNKSRKAVAVVNEREISAANFFSNYEF